MSASAFTGCTRQSPETVDLTFAKTLGWRDINQLHDPLTMTDDWDDLWVHADPRFRVLCTILVSLMLPRLMLRHNQRPVPARPLSLSRSLPENLQVVEPHPTNLTMACHDS